MKKLKNIRFLAAMILVLLLSASYSSKENTVTKVYAKKVKKALKQLLYIYILKVKIKLLSILTYMYNYQI